MDVAFVGEPPAASPVRDGLRALEVDPVAVDLDGTGDWPFVIVAGASGAGVFDRSSRRLNRPWIGVELGGMGGWHLDGVDGVVAVFGTEGPCHRCLGQRVAAATDELEPGEESVESTHARFAGIRAAWLVHTHGMDGVDALVGTVEELDGTRRHLHPVPGCRCAPDRDRCALDLTYVERDLETSLHRIERALDDRIGLVAEVGEQESFPAPYYLARLNDTAEFSDRSAAELAAGVDHDWNAAFMRALGEALERYCAGIYRLDALPDEPGEEPVALDGFALAEARDEPVGRWWSGIDLAARTPVSLPVEAVVFPPPEGAHLAGITTGLGLGSSTVAATLRGLLEVIERDACMLAWYSTFEPIRLGVDNTGYRTLERRAASEGLGVTSLLVTQDIDVPVVTSVVHRRDAEGDPMVSVPGTSADDWPAFAVGSSADLNPAVAAERALAEAIQNWMELAAMGPDQAEAEGAIATFANFPRQARSLLEADHAVPADAVAPGELATGEAALERVIAAVSAADLDGYVARLTTRDVAGIGFEAVRVLLPAAQPLVRNGRPSSPRTREVPRTLGFSPRLDRGPHPYP